MHACGFIDRVICGITIKYGVLRIALDYAYRLHCLTVGYKYPSLAEGTLARLVQIAYGSVVKAP